MSELAESDWSTANRAYLMAALDCVRAALERYLGRATEVPAGDDDALARAAEAMPAPAALDRLTRAFGLSAFERDLLLLCAGVELDAGFAELVRQAQKGRGALPSFSLALAVLHEPHWSALAAGGPLRYWKMIEVGGGEGLVNSPLRVDERVLHYLAGVAAHDERLQGLVERRPAPRDLPDTGREAAAAIRSAWSSAEGGPWPIIQLCGEHDSGLADVAAAACAGLGMGLQVLTAADVPPGPAERELLLRLWARESVLADSALLILVDGEEDAGTLRTAAAFAARVEGALLLAGREPLRVPNQTPVRFDVRRPEPAEQSRLWRASLGPLAASLNGQIDALVRQFDLGAPAITAAAARVRQASPRSTADGGDGEGADGAGATGRLLWDICRAQSRARLDDMAQRIETSATWEDLVLPVSQFQTLRDIVTHVRQRARVYDEWGFAAKSSRGLGISALFAGPSGTGKTLAAEILANELRLDLYRIDLSQVVSKYIGETEKNLRRVFDAAEAGGAVLLFDEADALFGKRSEVKDSHDRYANIEVSYLLQRMEAYRGLAILTTNMRQALDVAFTRRIRFILTFPFPDASQRAEIWRRMFPPAAPVEGLDYARLAKLNVPGGNIRNIALGAAFLAAGEGTPVRMTHLLHAARAEYAKIERSLTESETAGWA